GSRWSTTVRGFVPPRPRFPGAGLLKSWATTGRGDLVAGVAVAAYLVPQCLAYARLAGLEPVSGLWAAFPALTVYALLGTSRVLSLGPESATALLAASTIAALSGSTDIDPGTIAAALAVAVAAIAFVAWLVRLSFLADLLSKPVLVGYLGGVAVTMIVSQLPTLTGIASDHRDTLGRAADVFTNLGDAVLAPALMGAGVLIGALLLQRFKSVPGPLLVVLVASAATAWFDLDRHGIETVGSVPGGLPSLAFPTLPGHLWLRVFAAAAGVALVAFGGNILTARAFVRPGDERIDTEQELLALSGANAVAGIFGGFPVSTSDSRSALLVAAGGRTQLVGLVTASCVVLVLLFGRSMMESFPQAALGGLIVYAATRLIDLHEMRRIVHFRWSEGVIMLAAFVGVVAFGLLIGIAMAVGLSVADLFRRIARAHDAVQGQVPGLAGLHDVDDYPNATTIPGLVVYRYDAPLCFANAEDFRTRVLEAVAEEQTPVEWVLLNMEANVEIDLTAATMLDDLRGELELSRITLAMARVKRDLAVFLARTGLDERIGAERIFPTLPTALEAFRARGTT
ncbi:MAG TPA: sulfate permease, partial [Ilumatobacteraceae bacterium]